MILFLMSVFWPASSSHLCLYNLSGHLLSYSHSICNGCKLSKNHLSMTWVKDKSDTIFPFFVLSTTLSFLLLLWCCIHDTTMHPNSHGSINYSSCPCIMGITTCFSSKIIIIWPNKTFAYFLMLCFLWINQN